MIAFDEFENMDPSFWAFVKYISENLGYTLRGSGVVKTYGVREIQYLCERNGIRASDVLVQKACGYIQRRAELLNNFVEANLMDALTAKSEYLYWEQLHRVEHYYCKLPMNKQKGEKRQKAFFTSIINILTEKTLREEIGIMEKGFDDDPHNLVYLRDEYGNIRGASSRRFDGAFPSTENPAVVWEIKEYYYATTFGSRVADGVYETQLDGFEFNEIFNRTGRKIYHVLFIDAYGTWWEQGKSYLCRIIDALNSGIVDEVIVGREVLTRWPELLRTIIHSL